MNSYIELKDSEIKQEIPEPVGFSKETQISKGEFYF